MEFLSLTGGCTGSSESIHVKIPDCCKSHIHMKEMKTKEIEDNSFIGEYSPSFSTVKTCVDEFRQAMKINDGVSHSKNAGQNSMDRAR